MRRRIPKEREADPTPLTMGQVIQRYLVRHPCHVSDIAYLIEIERDGKGVVMDSQTPPA